VDVGIGEVSAFGAHGDLVFALADFVIDRLAEDIHADAGKAAATADQGTRGPVLQGADDVCAIGAALDAERVLRQGVVVLAAAVIGGHVPVLVGNDRRIVAAGDEVPFADHAREGPGHKDLGAGIDGGGARLGPEVAVRRIAQRRLGGLDAQVAGHGRALPHRRLGAGEGLVLLLGLGDEVLEPAVAADVVEDVLAESHQTVGELLGRGALVLLELAEVENVLADAVEDVAEVLVVAAAG